MTQEPTEAKSFYPVDIFLYLFFVWMFSFPPNLFLSFFPFGRGVGYLFSAFLASLLVGLILKGKRPSLALAKERRRWARNSILALLVISTLATLLLASSEGGRYEPPLLGAYPGNARDAWITTAIGVPIEVFLLFLLTWAGLSLGVGRLASTPAIHEAKATGQPSMPPPVPTVMSLRSLGIPFILLVILGMALDGAAIQQNILVLPLFDQTTDLRELLLKMNSVGGYAWLNLIFMLQQIAAAVIFLMWLFRANKNLHLLGCQGLDSTPGWVVGWWFIPVMNLFKPYQDFRQIWKASDNHFDLKDPKSWKAAPGQPLILIWWIFWLLSWASLNITGTWVNVKTLKILNWVSLGKNAAYMVSAGLILYLVYQVSHKQEGLIAESP